jgi:signal transduction histidine kinase
MRARLFRTTSVRLAGLGVGVATLSAGIMFGVIYFGTIGAVRATLDGDIGNEIAEITIDGARTPLPVVAAGVRAAIAEPPAGTFYLLTGRDGRVIAGNIVIAMPRPGWHDLAARRDHEFAPHITDLRARVEKVGASGAMLLVAENATTLVELDALIRRSFILAFAITLLVGMGAGIGFGRRALARIEAVSAAGETIMKGDFTRRIPVSRAGDEFDHLAAVINTMLARIEALMGNLRAVGDEIAHDLRSPLARLRESLELLLIDRTPEHLTPARVVPAIEDAIVQVDATLALAAGILRLAQIESGARRAGFALIDLTSLLNEVGETYEAVAEDAGMRLETDIARGLATQGDAALLTQCFANLLENAITHANPADGGDGRIDLAAHRAGDEIIVRIADRGPGIPVARRAEALRRFGRLDASRTSGGHGLGLPLAAAIASLHESGLVLDATGPGERGLSVTLALRAV